MRGDIVEVLSRNETVQTFRNRIPGELDAGTRDMTTRKILVDVREIPLKTQTPLHRYRTLRRKPAAKRYSDHELLDFLHTAGTARRGTLSIAFYDDFANGRYTTDRRRWPTHQTHCKRFGSWSNALRAAGMHANEQRAGREAAFDADRCLQAIRIVHRKLERTPTSLEYSRCARDSTGSLPSLSTIRNRYGSWLAALDAAERERVAA
jgi:hypothetical protein